MLEGVVANLLNTYLGQFLEGLDAEQFKISVWGGQARITRGASESEHSAPRGHLGLTAPPCMCG